MFLFKKRKQLQEVQTLMRRIVDLSTPDLRHHLQELRKEKRANRSLPVLVVPIIENEPMMCSTTFGVSRNLSSSGISLLVQELVDAKEFVVGFWLEGRCEFFRGVVRHRQASDGGFWLIGGELTEVVQLANCPDLSQLAELANRLSSGQSEQAYAQPAAAE